jgi:hypothetical protein
MIICSTSCLISTVFIIGMIYFYGSTGKSEIVKNYRANMSNENKMIYDKIVEERLKISYQGYALGFIISLIIIFYNLSFKSRKLNTIPITCIVIVTSVITNYFYYILSPKTDTMLNYVKDKKDAQAWYTMYKEMQYSYHLGLVLGIIAVGFMSFAFRC